MKTIFALLFLAGASLSFTIPSEAAIEELHDPECHAYAVNAANEETSFWAKLFQNGEWEMNYDYYYGLCINNDDTILLDPVILD